MEHLIKLSGIEKRYGKRVILSELDLSVKQGELLVINGASGQGKTTLLNIIGLLDSFQSGRYFFEGKDVMQSFSTKLDIRSEHIGFVFQDYCLLEKLTVMDNILMPYLYSDVPLTKEIIHTAEEYLERFGLVSLKKTKAKYLSGGEKQRVSIIRAMIKKPALVLADEPTGNLDPANARLIADELRTMTKDGTSVIVVTHNKEVFDNADMKYMLRDGRLYNE